MTLADKPFIFSIRLNIHRSDREMDIIRIRLKHIQVTISS